MGDEQNDNQDQQPQLTDEHKQKLGGIVQQMIDNKESDEDIRSIIGQYKQKYGSKPAPKGPAPIDWHSIATSSPNDSKFQTSEQQARPIKAPQSAERFDGNLANEHANAAKSMNQVLNSDEYAKAAETKNGKAYNQKLLHLNTMHYDGQSSIDQLNKQKSDLYDYALNQANADNDKTVKDSYNNDDLRRSLLEETKSNTAKSNPALAKTINASLYTLDSKDRVGGANDAKIFKNIQDLKSGAIAYDTQHKRLTKDMGGIGSFIAAAKEHSNNIDRYHELRDKSQEETIADAESKMQNENPDEVKDTPVGVGAALGGMISPGAKVTALSFAGSPELGAVAMGDDAYKTTFAQTFDQRYAQLRKQGAEKEEAYHQAMDEADYHANIAFGTNTAAAAAGGRLGGEIPAMKVSDNFVNTLKNVAKTSEGYLKHTLPEAGVQGSLAAGGKVLTNLKDGRPAYEGVDDEIGSTAMLVGGLAALGTIARTKITPEERSTLADGYAKMPKTATDEMTDKLIATKSITPEEATAVNAEIDRHRALNKGLHDDVPQENKEKIKSLMQKRDALQWSIDPKNPDALDKAYHGDIKEQVDGVKKETADGKTEGKDGINEQIRQLSQPIKSEPISEETPATPKEAGAKLVVDAAAKEKGGLTGTFKTMAQSDPAGFLKFVADQVHGGRRGELESEDGISKSLVDAAIAAHPEHELRGPGLPEQSLAPKESAVHVTMPEDNKAPNVVQNVQSVEHEPISEQEVPAITKDVENPKTIGITHEQMNSLSKELGLPEYQESPETFKLWDKQADERFAKDPEAMDKVVSKLRNGGIPDHVEQRMMMRYMADLKAKYDKAPSQELLAHINRIKDLSNVAGGRMVGQSLAARKGERNVEETLADYHLRELEAHGVGKLTVEQERQATKEHAEISGLKDSLAKKEAELALKEQSHAAELAKAKAEGEIKKSVASKKSVSKKTKEDFTSEREKIFQNIKNKWKESDGQLSATIIPYADRLVKIAPDVMKLVGSYIEEGVVKLADITSKVHEQVKEVFPEATEKDIHDIIAGEYSKKPQTRNDLQAKIKDTRDEAKLINRLHDLENGVQPKSEKLKVKRNQEIETLQNSIKDFHAQSAASPEGVLQRMKENSAKKLAALEEDLKSGNFLNPKEKAAPLPKEDAELTRLKRQLFDKEYERKLRLAKAEYNKRGWKQKASDNFANVMNVPRAIMSTADFSAVLRQGLVPSIAHPGMALNAAKQMFEHAFSESKYKKWFHDIQRSPEFETMKKSNLFLADPHDPTLVAKEEAFMTNLVEKIPVLGKIFAGSERAYSSYLNKMRVNLFEHYKELLETNGKTIANDEDGYKGMGSWVNNATGRGSLGSGALNDAAPFLNGIFFSPRLIASRLNLLGLGDAISGGAGMYGKMPKEIRRAAFSDMAKFIGVGVGTLALFKLNGAQVEADPRSTNFGKIQYGDTRYDIWGGFSQDVRLMAQLLSGQKKSAASGKISEIDAKDKHDKPKFGSPLRSDIMIQFIKGKLSPNVGLAWDLADKKNSQGQSIQFDFNKAKDANHVSLRDEAFEHLMPLLNSDVGDAVKAGGWQAAVPAGLASIFGVGVQTYHVDNKKEKGQAATFK